VRGIAASGPVYRPTGTFVDPGRFAAMAVVALAIALAAILVGRRLLKLAAIASAVTAAGAIWVTGVRGSLTIGVALVVVTTASVVWAERRPTLRRPVGILAAGVSAVLLINAFFPVLFSSRLIWYASTLDPRSPSNEWAFRWGNYSGNTLQGLGLGGVIGQGTGKESLGTQYLYGGATRSSAGLHQVEGGYASVALEWGAVGLLLWIVWSLAWVKRQWNAVRQAKGSPLARAGVVLAAWTAFFLFVDFFAGLQTFQNYIGNAYFWLLSGILFAFPELVKATSGKSEPMVNHP
jgi:O-antigen ligase